MKISALSFFAAGLILLGSPANQAQQPTPLLTQSAEQSIRVLQSNASLKEKMDACRQLSVIGGAEAVQPLAALLPDEKLNHMARYALEAIPDPAAGAALRQALESLQGRPLVGVIASVGVRKDAEAVPLLAMLLLEKEGVAAEAAARSLGQIATPSAAAVLRRALRSASEARRWAIGEGLLRCAEALAADGKGEQAIIIYDDLRALKSPAHTRLAGLRGAILVRGKEGLALLQQTLQSEEYASFAAAVDAAYEMPSSGVTAALAAALPQVPDPDRKVLLIQALGQRPDSGNLRALSQAAKNEAKVVRTAAVLALAETGNGSAAALLADLAVDADREIAQAAMDGLAGLQGRQPDSTVVAMLESSSVPRRLAGMELAARRRMTGCLPDILRAAKEGDAEIRPVALSKIGELGSVRELAAVLEVLPTLQSPADLDAAEQALAALCAKAERPERCVSPVVAALSDVPPAQRRILLQTLATIGGPQALEAVRKALRQPDYQSAALRALAAWRTPDAAPDLLELAKNASRATDRTIALRSYLGLAANPDVPAAQRLEICREAAEMVRSDDDKRMLLSVLGAADTADALEFITPHLESEGAREEASAAVVALSGKILKGETSAPVAARLAESLRKVTDVSENEDVVRRAKRLLEQTEKKR